MRIHLIIVRMPTERTTVTTRTIQLETIREMALESQRIVARLDDLLFKIKALAATLWSATCGWALTAEAPNLLIVAFISVLGLWFVAATFRGAQKRYIRCSDVIYQFLTNSTALDQFRASGEFPAGVPASLCGYESRIERVKLLVRGFVSPTVWAFYGLFALITIVLIVVTT